MRLAWLIPILAIACTGDDDAVDTGAVETSTTDPSSTSAPTTTDPDDSSGSSPTTTTSIDETSASSSGSADSRGSSSDGGSTSSADGSSSSSESTGPLPDGCDGIDMIELLDPYVTPLDAGSWLPGGSVTVGATMHNPGPDFLDYPSIVVESDNALVTSGAPGNQLFGILMDQSIDIYATFDADDSIAHGTDVTFTIRMASLDNVCPNGDSVEVVGTVE